MPSVSHVALLMLDIKDSTPLSKSLGGRKWLELLGRYFNPVITAIIEDKNHPGKEFQTQSERGDDCVKAYFFSPRDAVACAVDVQNRFQQFGMPVDEAGNEVVIRLHAALHFCPLLESEPVVLDVSEIPDLARLLKESRGGQILLSEAYHTAYSDKHGDLPFPYQRSPRKVKMKGIPEPQYFYFLEGYGEPETRLLGFENVVASDKYIDRKATEQQVREAFKKPIGRASETRFVTIDGEGGMGKTRLGVICAQQMARHFPGGVVFVSFTFVEERDPTKAAGAVADAIYRALRLPDAPPDQQIEDILRAKLQDLPPLLFLLDNAETIAGQRPAVAYLQTLLNTTREQKHCFLATSRRRLGLQGEVEIDVNDGLTAQEAFALFRERKRTRFVLPKITPADLSRLDDLLKAADYRLPPTPTPRPEEKTFSAEEYSALRLLRLFHLANYNALAIELIASGTSLYLTPGDLLSNYEAEAFSSLTETDLEMPERQRSLLASYHWSWKTLGAEENGADAQAAFLAASLFVDTFSAEALQAVLGWEEKRRVERAHKALVDAALCRAEPVNGVTRFRMHWQLQAYGRERRFATEVAASPLPSQAELYDRCIAYYNAKTSDHGYDAVFNNAHDRAWIEAEWRNIVEAAEYADTQTNFHSAVWLRLSLSSYFQIISDWRNWEYSGLKAKISGQERVKYGGSRSDEGGALNNLGIVYQLQGRWQEAEDAYNASLPIQRALNDKHGEGQTLNNLGNVYQLQGRWQEAEAAYNASLPIQRALNDKHGEGGALNNLGIVYELQGRWQEAEDAYNASLPIQRALNDKHGEGQTLNNLGNVYQLQGRWQEAEDAYNASLPIQRALNDKHGEGGALNNLGIVYELQGRWQEAEDAYNASLSIRRALNDKHGEGQTLNNLGGVYRLQGRWQEAEDAYNTSLSIRRALNDKHGEGGALNNLGIVYELQGRWQEAEDAYNASLSIRRALNDKHGEGQTLNNLGGVYQLQGRWQEAEDAYNASLSIKRALNDKHGEGSTLGNLSMLYLDQERLQDARTFARQAVTAFGQTQDTAALEKHRALLAHCESKMRETGENSG